MFDLNEQIHKWRNRLAQSQSLGKEDIDELEGHLRAEIDGLNAFKLSDDEKFWIAAHRLGNIESLSNEYAKINRGMVFRQKASLMITGILIYMMTAYFARFVSEESVRFAIKGGVGSYGSLGLVGFITQILALVIVIFLGFFAYKITPGIPVVQRVINQLSKRISFLTILLVFLATVFCYGAALRIPVPAFRNMDIQKHASEALVYTHLLWSVLLPAVLVLVVIKLRPPHSEKAGA
ncbi:MAG: hypothetical protein ABIF19_13900 [Planctomycetota bacterium]